MEKHNLFEMIERIWIDDKPHETFIRQSFKTREEAIAYADRNQRGARNDPDTLTYIVRDLLTNEIIYESNELNAWSEQYYEYITFNRNDKNRPLTRFEYQAMIDPYMDTLNEDGIPIISENIGPT